DPNLRWYARAMAGNAAIEATRDAPELRARITATLRELLADLVARESDLSDEEVSMATSLVIDLAHLADPHARELSDAAVAAGLSEMMSEEDVDRCYRRGGETARPRQEDWLTDYGRQYRNHLEADRQRGQFRPAPIQPSPARPASLAHPAPLTP